MDGLDLVLAGLASGSDGLVLDLAGLGLAALGLAMDLDVRLDFSAVRLPEGLSGGLSEALCSIRICTGVTAMATRTEVTRISIDESKRAPLQGPFYIGRMS